MNDKNIHCFKVDTKKMLFQSILTEVFNIVLWPKEGPLNCWKKTLENKIHEKEVKQLGN